MSEENAGSCNCGAVRFRTRGTLRGVIYCHCLQCRKQSGHYFAATSVASADLEIDGADALTWYSASPTARRGFCRHCGCALFWRRVDGASTSILAGAFDTPAGLRGLEHIFVEEQGDYYEINDGLPHR